MIKIRTKLLAVFLFSIFALAAVSLFAVFLINRLTKNTTEARSLSRASEEITVHAAGIIDLTSLYRTVGTDKQQAIKIEYEYSEEHLAEAVRVLRNSGKFGEEIPFLEKNNQKVILGAEKVMNLADERLKKEKHLSEDLIAGLRENRHKILDTTGSATEKLQLALADVGYKDKEFNFQYQDKEHAEEWTKAIGLLQAELDREGLKKLLPFADTYSALAKEAISERFGIDDLKLQESYNLELARGAFVEMGNYSAVISQAIGRESESVVWQGGMQRAATTIIILLAVFLGSGAIWLVSRSVTAPIERLVEIARKTSGGDLSQRAAIRTKDEIGYLSTVFDAMLDNIQSFQERLEEEKQSVEKKVEERTVELCEEKRKLETIAQNVGLGVILLDKEGSVLFANEDVQMLVGSARGKGSGILDALKRKFPDADIEGYIRQCVEGRPFTVPEARTGGSIFKIAFRCAYESTTGAFAHLILINDITAAKLLEHAKTDFIAITSHELRTPLAIIRGSAERLLKLFARGKTGHDTIELAGDIREESVRLLQVVNDFLDLTVLEEKRMQPQKEQFDLGALVKETVAEFEAKARQKNLFCVFTPPASLPLAYADKERTKQALVNLIGNAIQYTERGGVTIALAQADSFVKASVTDTGMGVSPEQQKTLFQKFQTIDERFIRSREYGSGMGLYISKMIVESMGGTIALERSEVGAGSTFSFTLPIAS